MGFQGVSRGEWCSGFCSIRGDRVRFPGPYLVLGKEAEQRASQRLVAMEGAVVRPDSGRCHEVVARSFSGRIGL